VNDVAMHYIQVHQMVRWLQQMADASFQGPQTAEILRQNLSRAVTYQGDGL